MPKMAKYIISVLWAIMCVSTLYSLLTNQPGLNDDVTHFMLASVILNQTLNNKNERE